MLTVVILPLPIMGNELLFPEIINDKLIFAYIAFPPEIALGEKEVRIVKLTETGKSTLTKILGELKGKLNSEASISRLKQHSESLLITSGPTSIQIFVRSSSGFTMIQMLQNIIILENYFQYYSEVGYTNSRKELFTLRNEPIVDWNDILEEVNVVNDTSQP